MKHTKYDLYKEDLYIFLYVSLLWCKQITYEDKNEVHSTSFMVDFASTQPSESGWNMYFYTFLMIWGQLVISSCFFSQLSGL